MESLVKTLEREPEEVLQKQGKSAVHVESTAIIPVPRAETIVDVLAVELRRKVLEWLTPVDYEETHQRHFKKHFANTGQWLIENDQFVSWKDTPGSRLLWCYGIRELPESTPDMIFH